MKFIKRVTLVIYSAIILMASIFACLLVFGWLDFGLVTRIIENGLTGATSSNIILGCSVVFILTSLLCIFSDSSSNSEKSSGKSGILLENDSGKLMISRDTLENLVNSIAKDFDSAEEISTRIEIDKENCLIVFVNLVVSQNATIKELSSNLQTKIKEAIKKASDLDVKEVNIKVRNIAPKKENVQ